MTLEDLGAQHNAAKAAHASTAAKLRTEAIAAVDAGQKVSAVARKAGIDRMTLLDWIGQRDTGRIEAFIDTLDLPVTVHIRQKRGRIEASLGVADLGSYGDLTSDAMDRRCAQRLAAELADAGWIVDPDELAPGAESDASGWAVIRRRASSPL